MSKDFTIHMIPVFEKDLPAVWGLLAQLNPELGGSGPVGPAGSVIVSRGAQSGWTEKDLRGWHRMLKPVQRAIVTRVAEAGTQQKAATYEELRVAGSLVANSPSFSYDKLRGNLAWLSKYAFKVRGETKWPFEFKDKGMGVATGERYEYFMESEIADLWLQISRVA